MYARILCGSLAAATLVAANIILFTASGVAAGPGGAAADRLRPCPATPNCVSTLSADAEHAMSPIVFNGTAEEAKARLLTIVNALPRTRIVQDDGPYLHFEFTSRIFRFVDDVEFYVDESARRIEFRSASRAGRWDMGVNRRRMQSIVDAYVHAAGSS